MHHIPDMRVWKTANEYQEVASLCNEHRKGWGGAINAALAIEIYLKSFLSEEVRVAIYHQACINFRKTERGHDLLSLFKKIPCHLQNILCEQYKLIKPNLSLEDLLEKHKDVFFYGRYFHEKDAMSSVGNDIIFLAEDLREAVKKVSEIVRPIIKPDGLEEKVAKRKARL